MSLFHIMLLGDMVSLFYLQVLIVDANKELTRMEEEYKKCVSEMAQKNLYFSISSNISM